MTTVGGQAVLEGTASGADIMTGEPVCSRDDQQPCDC